MALEFEQLLEIVKLSVNGIFNDEGLGQCVYKILDDGFEENEEVLEDLKEFDDCTIVPDASTQIIQDIDNNIVKYKWDESTDQQILYQLLSTIFINKITDTQSLINQFSKPLPNTLIQCTNQNILTISHIITHELNKNAKKTIDIEHVTHLFTEQKLDGNALSNMKPKEFMDKYSKKYKIASAKGRKLFNGITRYCDENKRTDSQSTIDTEITPKSPSQTEHSTQQQNDATVPTNLSECETSHLLSILNENIFANTKKPSEQNKNNIILYITENKVTGTQILDMKRKEFGANLVKYCNDTKVNGTAVNVYKKLTTFDFSTLKQNENDELTCNAIRRIARDLTSKPFENVHNKMQKCIKRNGIDGKSFMNKFNISLHQGSNDQTFIDFFHAKICDDKNKKYIKFAEWFQREIKQMKDTSVISKKNKTDFTKFILDGFDEFISNIFRIKNINGNMFITRGGRAIAAEIRTEYQLPKGPLQSLCQAIENYIQTNNFTKSAQKNAAKKVSMVWTVRPSQRTLPLIDDESDEIIASLTALDEGDEHKKTNDIDIVWNDVQCVKNCNSAQISFILTHYILPTFMDKDIVQKYEDKIIEYFREHKLDGQHLLEMSRKKFGADIVEFVADQKLTGNALKIYSAFQKFDLSQIPNNDVNIDGITSTEQCTAPQIVYILDKYILNDLNHRELVLSYFTDNNVDGKQLFAMKRKEFGANIVKQGNGNTKLNGPAVKLYNEIKKFDISSIRNVSRSSSAARMPSVEQSETSSIWDDDVRELKQCNYKQIVCILNEYIFAELPTEKKFDAIRSNKDLFIAYFEDKKVNGEYLMNVDRKVFSVELAEYGNGNTKLRGPALKLLKLLQEFDFNKIIQGAVITLPLYVEQCTNEQLIYLLENILNDNLLQHKGVFIAYFIDKKMDGETLKQMKRKEFSASMVEFANGNKKLNGPATKLFDTINKYTDLKNINNEPINEVTKQIEDDLLVNFPAANDEETKAEPMNVSWKNKPKTIEECTVDQITFILANYVLNDDKFKTLQQHKSDIVKFINENAFGGSKLINMRRKEFANQLTAYLGGAVVLGVTIKIYSGLVDFELLQIPELKQILALSKPIVSKLKLSKKRNSASNQLKLAMESIDEHKTSTSTSPHHTRSPSAPTIFINGKIMQRNGSKHRRFPTTIINKSQTQHLYKQSQRTKNEQLAMLQQDEFCEWVVRCTECIAGSKTVQNMIECIVNKHQLTGKVLIKSAKNEEALKDFIQTNLNCNEVYFLKYLTRKIISDHEHNAVPFDNFNCEELAEYVQRQSYLFPASAFRKCQINGDEYCDKNSKMLLDFLRKQCGFRAGTARPLMANIDKYPEQPSNSNSYSYSNNNNNTNFNFNLNAGNQRSTFDKLASYTNTANNNNNNNIKRSEFYPRGLINDDAQSDASEANEYSVSHSVNPHNGIRQMRAETLFADHSYKIYKRENERHWRRINERLNKVGIDNLLMHMNFRYDDDEKHERKLEEKYFVKQAKLVYKIQVDLFYDEIYQDIITESLGFDTSFNKKDARRWIINYELSKLHKVIVENRITKIIFKNKMVGNKNDVFCKKYMAFLPKKRRKVLFKKLKKDLSKGKLNHM